MVVLNYFLWISMRKEICQQVRRLLNIVTFQFSTWALLRSPFVSWKVIFWKLLFKLSCVYLLLEKLVNGKRKHFLVKRKLGLVSRKVFSIYFGRKTLSRICKKLKSILLFVDYIKFSPQSFDCYIFCFKSLFY